jgi:predicted ribosomally synthesized peptide with nif11-like leader
MLSKVMKKFFKDKNVDESFNEKVDEAKTIAEIADIVSEPGLEMSTDDFNDILSDIIKDELSEDDLQQIAGGLVPGNN